MKKIKITFMVISFASVVLMILWFNQFDFSVKRNDLAQTEGIGEFQVTAVAGLGSVFLDPAYSRPMDLKTMNFSGDTSLNSDEQTAFEFVFQGIVFVALPGSQVQYSPQTKELYFARGEFFWNRKIEGNRVEISFLKPGNIFYVSNSGRIRMKGNSLEIWNYAGELDLNFENSRRHLKPLQWVSLRETGRAVPIDLLPPPQFISPEGGVVVVTGPSDTFISFKWKNVPGVRNFLIKFYPSSLRENVLFSKVISGNGITVDVLPFIDGGKLFWDVCAVDVGRNVESCPSVIGSIELTGVPAKRDSIGQSPKIEVESLSVSGNVVLIRGTTHASVQLFINDVPVRVDSDGKFIHTISYKTIGAKEILFRVMTPAGISNTVKRQITIFEEVSEE